MKRSFKTRIVRYAIFGVTLASATIQHPIYAAADSKEECQARYRECLADFRRAYKPQKEALEFCGRILTSLECRHAK